MAAVPPSQNSSRYSRIGKYEIRSHIATGGMGVVYRAFDPDNNREVALKILPPDLAAQPDKLERFRREARHAARLRHKNIARVYEFGEASGTLFLAMELVEGVNLHDFILQEGKLAPKAAFRILYQAARALEHLHRRRVVHRDIKPANFLLTFPPPDGDRPVRPAVKLTDLGLAREVNDQDFRVTREGTTVGTVDYMAPEQARDSGAADIRSDIYALGCTWYHMLAGKPPFPEGSVIERLYKHIETEPADVREFCPTVPARQVEVLRRMLAKKPADRYQTPTELLAALLETRKRPTAESRPVAVLAPPPPPSAEPRPAPAPPPSRVEEPPAPPPPTRTEAPAGVRTSPSTQDMLAADQSSSLVPVPSLDQQRVAAAQFERALQVIQAGDRDYGIHLLLSCCKLDPANFIYRRTLRQTEKTKYLQNRRGKRFAWLTSLPARRRLQAARRAQDHLKVLEVAEEVLAHNPWDVKTQLAMAEAADALGLVNLAVWLLEQAREEDAKHRDINRALARLYEKRGNYAEAIGLWELIQKLNPADFEAGQQIKDLSAHETIARGRYKESLEKLAGERRRGRGKGSGIKGS